MGGLEEEEEEGVREQLDEGVGVGVEEDAIGFGYGEYPSQPKGVL